MGGKKKHDKEKKVRNEQQIEQAENRDKSDGEKEDQAHQDTKNQDEPKFQLIPPKKVSYCPACSLPFELCKYGKNPNLCIKTLYELAPTKVIKYHPDFKEEDITNIKKELKEAKKEQASKEEKKQKTVKDKYVVIDTKNRGKHKHVTTISGLGIFGIDAKDFSKKCSKKFACSCSAIEQGVAQIQGEFFEEIKQILIMEYKVKKKYILDGEEYKVKFNEQMAKKKEEKKLKNKEIKEADEKEEQDAEMKEKEEELKEGEVLPVVDEKPKNRLGFEIRSDSEEDDE